MDAGDGLQVSEAERWSVWRVGPAVGCTAHVVRLVKSRPRFPCDTANFAQPGPLHDARRAGFLHFSTWRFWKLHRGRGSAASPPRLNL